MQKTPQTVPLALIDLYVMEELHVPHDLHPAKIMFEQSGCVTVWCNAGKSKMTLDPVTARHIRGLFEDAVVRFCIKERLGQDRAPRLFEGISLVCKDGDDGIVVHPHEGSMCVEGHDAPLVIPIGLAMAIAKVQRAAESTHHQLGEGPSIHYLHTCTYEESEAIEWDPPAASDRPFVAGDDAGDDVATVTA